MKQKPCQVSLARVNGLPTGRWLAFALAFLFALTLIAIAGLMLCGVLIWWDLQTGPRAALCALKEERYGCAGPRTFLSTRPTFSTMTMDNA